MNAPLRPHLPILPLLALLGTCLSLLLIPAIATLGAAHPPGHVVLGPQAAARLACAGRACAELVEMEVRDVVPLDEAERHAVVLVTKDQGTVLPIFVDEGAAVAIAFRLAHRSAPHPLAQDLLDSMMIGLGGQLTEVRIEGVEDAVFTGRVLITQGQKHLSLEARPSDSISLALAHGAKIFASRGVLTQAGIAQADIERLKKSHRPHATPDSDSDPGTGGSGADPGADRRGRESQELQPPRKGDPIKL